MSSATGWDKHTIPNDVVVTGSIHRLSRTNPDTVDFTAKAKGERQFRIEVQNNAFVTVTQDDQVVVQNPNGARFIPFSAAISVRPLIFPFYSDLADFRDPHLLLQYVGLESINGQVSHRIDVVREPNTGESHVQARRRVQRMTVWIATDTFLPTQIAAPLVAEDNPTSAVTRVVQFSDYRRVSGLAVPFRQDEFINSKQISSIQLMDVRFNVGLSASDFSFPAVH